MVHRGIGDVEREPGDTTVHQDSEVIAEIGTSETQGPHAGDYENIPCQEETYSGILYSIRLQDVECGLVSESLLVKIVSDDAQREDNDGKEVAAVTGITAEELGEDFVVVFCRAELETVSRVKVRVCTLTRNNAIPTKLAIVATETSTSVMEASTYFQKMGLNVMETAATN
jgi:hypothetical protein